MFHYMISFVRTFYVKNTMRNLMWYRDIAQQLDIINYPAIIS